MSQLPPPDDATSSDLFDYEFIRNVVGFIFRGVRRHRWLSLATFALVAGLGLTATWYYPRTFHCEAKLLANRSQLIRTLGNPRSSGLPSEDPTRAAEETVFAHDNLVSLIRQTKLLQKYQETRPPVLKLKDQLLALVSGPLSEEDKMDAMVGTLEKRLKVTTDSQTVTISIDWADPQMAYQLVDTAQQNFLETRHITEMTAISEALSILEMHASTVQRQVDDALHELERVREVRRKGGNATGPAPRTGEQPPLAQNLVPPPAPLPPPRPERTPAQMATEQELAQLKFLLNSKKRALLDLEDFRAKRLGELRTQLAEQKVMYAAQHPVVLDTQQRIAAVELDSPQVTQVKEDIANLHAEYLRKGGGDAEALVEPRRPIASAPPTRAVAQQAQAAMSLAELSDDPLVEFSRNSLRVASAKYEELMMRIDGARIEQDTARAAFKYRYSVVRPASVPKKPVSPNAVALALASIVGALGLALVSGAARDVWRGRLVEPWQVKSHLGLPVLSQVKVP